MSLIPDGRRLRQVREQQEYTIEHLAEAAGVGEKTIRNLESGRTQRARLPTLKALAAVLDIEVTDIARSEEDGGPEAPQPREASVGTAPSVSSRELPPASRLELLVERELAARSPEDGGRDRRHDPGGQAVAAGAAGAEAEEAGAGAGGPVLMLTPKKFQDVITAFQLHRDRRLWLPGVVLRQRGISEAEAHALGTECGIGARFLVGLRAELTGGEALHITVYTCLPEHTALLQERLEAQQELPMRVRVVVAPRDPETTPRFLGFAMYGSQTLHPWTFVLDEVRGGAPASAATGSDA